MDPLRGEPRIRDCRRSGILTASGLMAKFPRFMIPGLALQLLASCGSSGPVEVPDEGTPQQVARVKSGEMFDDDSEKILGRYGAMNPVLAGQSGGTASEASTVNQQFNQGYNKKAFEGKSYERKAFWGQKDYSKQVFQGDSGNKNFNKGAREGSQWASEGALVSGESGRSFDKGRDFGGSAREGSQRRLDRPSDAEVDVRRAVYKQPEVEDVQRKRALTVDDTRSLLGR